MRMIGHLDSGVKARSFSDYLTVKGIENQVEAEKDGTWSVWIFSEEQLAWAKELLELYGQNPGDPRYQAAGGAAEEVREKKRQEQLAYERRVKQRRHLFRPLTAYGFGPVTFVLILFSVVVFVRSKFGYHFDPVFSLFISEQDVPTVTHTGMIRDFLARVRDFKDALPEVRHGEVWRLLTPIFIHADILHIFFNMLWLRDLGSMIEARQNSWLFIVLVIVFGVSSDVAQYLVSGPAFMGMSGVVYGLFGYIWMRGKYDPGSGLYLHPSTVTMMIIYFFACLVGFFGGAIANTAHGVGLVMGMAWGFISSLRHR